MNTVFSQQDQTVRKWWLRIFLFQIALSLFSTIYTFPFDAFANTPVPISPLILAAAILTPSLVIALLWNYGIYHCAYKKQGTKLLVGMLILSIFGFVVFGIQVLYSLLTLSSGNATSFSLFANGRSISTYLPSFVLLALSIPFYILSMRLYRINRANNERV